MARHIAHLDSIHSIGNFLSVSALKDFNTDSLPDNTWACVESLGEYYFDKNSILVENIPGVIRPVEGLGRWIKKNNLALSEYNIVKVISEVKNNSESIESEIDGKLNLSGGTLTGDLILNGNPTASLQAATKLYVDSIVQGLDLKSSVKTATIENLTLSGLQTVDTVVLNVDDRILVKNQTDPAENGIYLVKSGSWSRTEDFDVWSEIVGAFVFVEKGETNNATAWVCISDDGGTFGTSPIVFTMFSSAGSYTADGQGIVQDGTVFKLKLDGSTLSKSSDGIKVAADGIKDAEIAASANIARTKLANGTPNQIIINDATGKISSIPRLSRAQIEAGTGDHIVVNDALGNLSSVASLPVAKGGTGLTSLGASNQILGMTSSGATLEYKTIGFTNGAVNYSPNTITLSIPQAIDNAASPTFSGLTLNGTGGLKVPAGNDAQRPSMPANGILRYNTSSDKLEVFENGNWVNLTSSGSGTSTVDYSFHFTIPGTISNGQVAGIGTNGTSFSTAMGFAIPVLMNIVEIAIDFGTFNAVTAGYLNVSFRELNTNSGTGSGTPITSSVGTEKYVIPVTTSTALSTTYHKTVIATGISSVQLTAGNLFFVAITGVNFINATDMSVIVRCKS